MASIDTVECVIDTTKKTITIPYDETIEEDLKTKNAVFDVIENNIVISGPNFLDFIGSFQTNEDIVKMVENTVPLKVWRTNPAAILPSKARFSDVGYDLTIIDKYKTINDSTIMYDTGIKVSVPIGYYIEIVPRSSMSKTGWMLANSIGIIDVSYTGNLYVALTRTSSNAPELELPFKGFQLIIRKQYYGLIEDMTDVENIGETSRGDGGFGSTNV